MSIKVEHLTLAYPGGAKALSEVSFFLKTGATLGLLGVNGSGKSTLLTLLAGLLTPTSGTLRVGRIRSPGRERELRRNVGLVLQDADAQILGATVEEDLCLGLDVSDPHDVDQAHELAERLGLADKWHTPVQELSWGQKRKLCLATSLRDAPDALLFDEPFSGLDYPGIVEMRALLLEGKQRELTQVVAAHDVEPLSGIVDVWAVLAGGRLAAWGDEVRVFPRLRFHGVRPPYSWLVARGESAWE